MELRIKLLAVGVSVLFLIGGLGIYLECLNESKKNKVALNERKCSIWLDEEKTKSIQELKGNLSHINIGDMMKFKEVIK